MTKLERNIDAFNADAGELGGYAYTSTDRWSTKYATRKQAEAVISMLARNFSRPAKIIDVGCGDGTFTIEIAERLGAKVRGIEPAPDAIDAAKRKIPGSLSANVSFEVDNIYDVISQGEEVAVLRGVMHHLDRPQLAISHLANQFPAVLLLEPNGYNPALKLIEKASKYHRDHDEKSYPPHLLSKWFRDSRMRLAEQEFFCLVPYFFPTLAAKALSKIEPLFESIPVIRRAYCGTNLALYRR